MKEFPGESPCGPNRGHFIPAQAEKGSKSKGPKPPRRVIVDVPDGGDTATIISPSPGRPATRTPEESERIVTGVRQETITSPQIPAQAPKKPERIVEGVRQIVTEATESGSLAEALLLAEEGVIKLAKKKSKPSSPDSEEAILLNRPKEQSKGAVEDNPITTGEQKPDETKTQWQAPQQTPADKTPPEEASEIDDDEVIELEEIGKTEDELLDKILAKIGERENITTTDFRLLEDDSLLTKIKIAENGEDTSGVTSYLVLQKKDGDPLVFGGKHAKEVDGETRKNAFKTINSAKQFEQESRKVETEIGDASDFEIDVQPSEIDVATLNEIELHQQMCNAVEKAARNKKGQEFRAVRACNLKESLANLLEDQSMDPGAKEQKINKIFDQIHELLTEDEVVLVEETEDLG